MLLRLPLTLLAALPLATAIQTPLAPDDVPRPLSRTLVDVLASDPNFTKLIRLLQITRLIPTLNKLNGSTIFAPNNDAIDRFNNKKPSNAFARALAAPQDDNIHEELRQHLFYHMLNETLDQLPSSVEFQPTLYFPRKPTEPPSKDPPPYPPWMPKPGGSLGGLSQRLRIAQRGDDNAFWVGVDSTGGGGVQLASDKGANTSNGIIYELEDVIEQPANIHQIITEHPQLSYLARIMPEDVAKTLHDGDALTLFLPVDETWQKLHPIERLYLESDFSTQDVTNVVNMHTISAKGVKWTDKLTPDSKYSTGYGNEVEVKRGDDGELSVGGARVVTRDIYAANGVIHLVESLLVPEGALQLTPEKYLLALNCTKFVSLLHSVDLTDMINRTDSAITILAPGDDVLGVFDDPDDLPESGSEELRQLLQYHFIPGHWTPDQLVDGALIETALYPAGLAGGAQVLDVSVEKKGGKGKDKEKEKEKVDISFGGASIIGDPVQLPDLNVIIYMITRPLLPPDDPLKVAVQQLHMSIFLAGVFSTGLENTTRTHPRMTLIIPDNAAFEQLGLVTSYLLLPGSKVDLERVISHHALDGVYYADEIGHGSALTYKTLEGSDVHLVRGKNGTLQVSGSGGWSGMEGKLATSNLLTTSGAIHEVSEVVLLPRSVPITNTKLAKAAKAGTMGGLVTRAGFDWILDGSPPPKGSPYATPDLEGAAWVLLAPTDDAFKEVNLTALHEDENALRDLVAQHIVPALPTSPPPVWGAPLYMGDAAAYTTGLSRDSYYGDVIFREVETVSNGKMNAAPTPQPRYVVGIRGARGTKALGDWAHVLAWGRSTAGSTGAGGGLVQIDAVLLPYQPPWYIKFGQPAALLIVGVAGIAGFWFVVWKFWTRDTTEATYEPLGGFARDDEDD